MVETEIKKIKKRDGRVVDFDQNKITQAVLGAGRETGEFNLEIAKKISDEVINTLNKVLKGKEKIPEVEQIQDIVEMTLMKEGYSKTAKAYILYRKEHQKVREEKKRILNGKMTGLPLSLNAVKILAERYLMRDRKTKNVTESPEEMLARVAKTLAQVEQAYNKSEQEIKQWKKKFYKVMVNFEFLPAGRTLANAGAPTPLVSNCIVLHIEDSMDGIFTTLHDAALLQQAGSGIGFPFHELREAGALAKRTQGEASGPISFLRVYDKAFGTIKQQGRHGANMAVMRVDHPDILDFIHAKDREGELSNFNISVALTDEFMREVEQSSTEPWKCKFGDEEMLPRKIVRDKHGAISKIQEIRITASELMAEIANGAWTNGEPGIIFIDEVNRTNPLPGLGKIKACNPCVTGDTWVMTFDGPRQVREILNQPFFPVINGQKWKSSTGFFETGTKSVYRLKTKEGFEVKLTSDHPVRRKRKKLEWVEVKNLQPGDKILLNNHSDFSWEGKYTQDQGYLMGLLLGDGTINRAKSGGKMVLSSWEDNPGPRAVRSLVYNYTDNQLEHRADFKGWTAVKGRDEYRLSLVSIDKIAEKLGVIKEKKITKEMERASSAFYKGLLRGLFDADGSVQGNQTKGVSIRLSQSNLKMLRKVQRLLLRLGIFSKIYRERKKKGYQELPDGKGGTKSYSVKAQHELVIANENLAWFYKRIGFGDSEKMADLQNALNSYQRRLNREHFLVEIEDISFEKEEKVYDVQIPGINAFDANGFYVHNCGEQFLHDADVCNLGSINLDKFVKNKKIDWDRLKKVTQIATRMLDNVIDMTEFPVERVNQVFKKNRRIGLGVMGFADLLFQLEIPYDSEQGFKTAEKIMKFINDTAHSTSQKLAEEKSVFPNYKLSVWKEKGIKMRNAALTCLAPTGSISMIPEVSSGVEPYFALAYTKQHILEDEEFYYINHYLEEKLRDRGLYSSELIKKIYQRGSIQGLEEIPKEIRKVFVGAMDIAPEDHIRMEAAFQKHLDNSISKTINMPNQATRFDVEEAINLAWKSKCKAFTVYRAGSREEEVLRVGEEEKEEPSLEVCPECDTPLVINEGCKKCPQCGWGLCS